MKQQSGQVAGPEAQRIVVLRPNHRLGNTLLLTPLIQELERRYPDAVIEIVASGRAAGPIFEHYSRVKAVHLFPSRSFRCWGQVLRLLLELRRRRYDIAIDPMPRSRAGRFLLSVVKARERIGYRWGSSFRDRPLTRGADRESAPASASLVPVHLLRTALPASAAVESIAGKTVLELHLTAAERCAGAAELERILGKANSHEPCIAIYAHATGSKCYAAAWWHRVIDAVRARGLHVKLFEVLPEDGQSRLENTLPRFLSRDLRHLGATLQAATLVVSADCGVMHLADAAGARVLGLFNVTDPARYGPTRRNSASLVACLGAGDSVDAVVGLMASLVEMGSPATEPCVYLS